MKTSKRINQLDILRILAVLLVLGRHMGNSRSYSYGRIIGLLTNTAKQSGWVGVDLFFVLSGFLVSGVLFKEYIAKGEIRFKRFFIRRGFKIYPAFYVLIITTVIICARLGIHINYTNLLSELFFVQNYHQGLWNHTWSLAVEEHFYLLLPLLLIILSKRAKPGADAFQQFPKLFVIIACLELTLRIVTILMIGYGNFRVLFETHLRLDSLLFGVLLSYYYHFKPQSLGFISKYPVRVLAFAAVMLAPSILFFIETSFFMNTFGLTFLYLGFGALLIGFLSWQPVLRFSEGKVGLFLGFLGQHSYSIYIWHMFVKIWGIALLSHILGRSLSPAVEFFVYIIGSIAFGVIMAKIVEFPILRLRDRLSLATNADSQPKPDSRRATG